MNSSKSLGVVALVAVPGLLLGLVFSIILLFAPTTPAAASCDSGVSVVIDGDIKVDGYTEEQLKNAAAIMAAGKTLELPVKGQILSVMVALGESGLRVLDRGDGPGPDSRGLFQQRDNGAWGSYEDRMDPTISATNFIKALLAVEGWEDLEPTLAANKVQRNQDPYHYQKYWPEAVKIVEALSDGEFSLEGSDCPVPGKSGAGDDYPWKTSPTWLQVGANAASTSPLGMYYRECTDFVLWRLNVMAGVTSDPWKFHNSDLVLGNAETWINAWHRQGWDSGQEPRVGAVAYYAANVGGAGSVGHVAIVSAINDDGTVAIEEYNGMPAPNDHKYSARNIQPGEVSAYLYYPGDD